MGDSRRLVRYAAAAIAVVVAAIYFAIGLGVVTVVNETPKDMSMFGFGVPAGSAFVIGAALLVAFDHRALWLLGALLQVGTIVMYFAISSQREPPFEVWGIGIKTGQALLLVALAYLAVRGPAGERTLTVSALPPR